jgi:formate dehydrogenase assembly factor FdhD
MNVHLVPFLNALRTSSCASCGSASIDWIEVRSAFAWASAAMTDAGTVPDLAASLKKAVTFDERTAAHCASPTVPPRDLNCITKYMRIDG